jgi:hypothetical protein
MPTKDKITEERFCSYCGAKESEKGILAKNGVRYLTKGLCNNCIGYLRKYGRLERVRASNKKYPIRLRGIRNCMIERCYNIKNPAYKNYGERGIKVCGEWMGNNSVNFCEWALSNGYGDELQIDRIDVNGDYTPDNCRFVEPIVNGANKRNTTEHNGVSQGGEKSSKWRARMVYKGKKVLDKGFKTFDEAINARKQMEIKYIGGIL